MSQYILKGRVWKFGDNMNTDLMMPNTAFLKSEEEQRKLVFESIRPGWSSKVREGDIIIGGKNFGTGSSRPASKLLRGLGIVAIVAETVNGLFLRNCINSGVIGLSCEGVFGAFSEGDIAEINIRSGEIVNVSEDNGKRLKTEELPEALINLALAGGIEPLLEKEGYLNKKSEED